MTSMDSSTCGRSGTRERTRDIKPPSGRTYGRTVRMSMLEAPTRSATIDAAATMRRSLFMVRCIGYLLAVVLVFAAGAGAASGWRVFASSSDSSEYGAYVSANAKTLRPNALAVQASMKADVRWSITCDGETENQPANRPLVASVAAAASCTLYGSADTDTAGTLRLRLLRR